MTKDIILYLLAICGGVTGLFFFIKVLVSSILADNNRDAKLEAKINEIENKHNDLHKTQSDLNTRAKHIQMLNSGKSSTTSSAS